MYNPKHFEQKDLVALRKLIHAYGFATLISHSGGGQSYSDYAG
jgi:predicted FMN-binding regulatory protein PaiB